MESYVNKKKKESQLKKRDKIYLLRKNLRNLQSSRKLDHKKIGLFIIKKRKNKINYELELSKDIRIHPIFYILLLESANPKISAIIKKSSGLIQSNKYKVKIIIKYDPKTRRYTIK